MILLWSLLACQEPFGSDRHTLEGFRVAAVGLERPDDGPVHAHALLVDGGKLWADSPTTLAWSWLEDPDQAADWTGVADHVGPWPELAIPAGGGTLLLVAIAPDGTERRAVLDVRGVPVVPPSVGPLAADRLPWSLSDLDDEELSIEARAEVDGTPAWAVPADGFLRIRESGERAETLSWMGTAGTWLELDPQTADWTPGSLVLDDEEVEQTERGRPGVEAVVALRPTRAGGAWRVHDLFVGDGPSDEDGAWVDGRWLPGAVPGWQIATLEPDDTVPLGLRAVAPQPFDPLALPPLSDQGSCPDLPLFQPVHLTDQRCLRADLTAAPVIFEGVAAADEAVAP